MTISEASSVFLGAEAVDAVYLGSALVWEKPATGVPWTPANIPANMLGWWDASDAGTVTFSGSNLTQWRDKSAAANHMVPWGVGPRLASINGLDALWYEYQGTRTTNQVSLNDFTSFAVFIPRVPGNYERLWDHSFTSGAWLGRQAEGAVWGGGVRNGTAPYGYYIPLADGVPHQISFQRSGAVQYVSGNGGAVVQSGAVTTDATSANYISIGASFDNATSTDMLNNEYVGEVIFWKRALTTDEMQRTEGYLAHKWSLQASLPAGHPYKAVPPTVPAGPAWGPDEVLYGPGSPNPGGPSDPNTFMVGARMTILADGRITHFRYYMLNNPTSRYVAIWSDTGTLLADATTSGDIPGSGWTTFPLATPLNVTAGQVIRSAYGNTGNALFGSFPFSLETPPIPSGADLRFEHGVYTTPAPAGADKTFPENTIVPNHYYGDVVFQKRL